MRLEYPRGSLSFAAWKISTQTSGSLMLRTEIEVKNDLPEVLSCKLQHDMMILLKAQIT